MLTRRELLAGSGACGALALLSPRGVFGQASGGAPPLPIPELFDARQRSNALELVAAEGRHAFLPERPAPTFGFSAPYLGPVLRLHRGDSIQITVENRLDEATTCHWHGISLPAAVDGGPHEVIEPGGAWRPVLKIDQPETTAWYHAHPHFNTGRQVYKGLAGMVIIEDGAGARLGLPRTYGVDDLPLIVQDRMLDFSGALRYSATGPSRMMGMRGETVIVNGVATPTAKVPRGWVRLRILNAANARNFDLKFADGRRFLVIASDGGYLSSAFEADRLLIAPSERFEALVDFSDGKPAALETGADPFARMMAGMGGRMMGGMGGMSPTGLVMRFEADASLPAAVKTPPRDLAPLDAPDASRAAERRRVSLDMGPGAMQGGGMRGGMRGRGMGPPVGINGRSYDPDRIDFSPKLGTAEIWEVIPNMMAHPFHAHGVIFRVLSIGGKRPPAHLAGGKDTILLDEPAELLLEFNQPASRKRPFMFHCHILEHEDGGMMGQYVTV